jgi:hypothetical protein
MWLKPYSILDTQTDTILSFLRRGAQVDPVRSAHKMENPEKESMGGDKNGVKCTRIYIAVVIDVNAFRPWCLMIVAAGAFRGESSPRDFS